MTSTPEQPTAQQLAHNDQILADVNARIDALIQVHRTALDDDDMHPQVALAGFAGYLEKHSDAHSMAQFLAVAIDRLAAVDHHARTGEVCDHPRGTATACDVCGGDVAALLPDARPAGETDQR